MPRDPLELLCAAIDVGTAQLGCQKMLPADNIERQKGVAVIASEERALLVPMQRVVGGVKIETLADSEPRCAYLCEKAG